MTRRQIDAARERRLWFKDVIMPLIAVVMMFPEARSAVVNKARKFKEKIEQKFRK